MNFTVQVKSLPQENHFLEVWWQALWLPQGLISDWVRAPRDSWLFRDAAPKGFVPVSMWGSEDDPDALSTRWVKIKDIRTGELSPQEGSTVVVDMAPSSVGWLLPLGIGVGVAALFLAKRRT